MTNEPVHCPKCKQPLTQVGAFWVCPQHGQVRRRNPLCSVIHGGRERYLIVIDALDEAGEAGRNPLVEMLTRHAQRLPDWLGLVVTSLPVRQTSPSTFRSGKVMVKTDLNLTMQA